MGNQWLGRRVHRVEALVKPSGVFVRDASGADVEAWTPLDAPPPGHCPFCWTAHAPGAPHELASPLYQARFAVAYGRAPTAADAAAHCASAERGAYRRQMAAGGLWGAPPAKALLYAETYRAPRLAARKRGGAGAR